MPSVEVGLSCSGVSFEDYRHPVCCRCPIMKKKAPLIVLPEPFALRVLAQNGTDDAEITLEFNNSDQAPVCPQGFEDVKPYAESTTYINL